MIAALAKWSSILLVSRFVHMLNCTLIFQLGPRRVHTVRTRGGNVKYRALRLDTGNFSWGSEGRKMGKTLTFLKLSGDPDDCFYNLKTMCQMMCHYTIFRLKRCDVNIFDLMAFHKIWRSREFMDAVQ